MDPNGSLTNDLGNYTSEDYICHVSPLHEALRGTTAMPTLEEFQKLNNGFSISTPSMNSMSITPNTKEEAMFPVDKHSMLSYHMDVAVPPLTPASGSILIAPTYKTSPPVAKSTEPSTIQGSPLAFMNGSLKPHEVFDPSPIKGTPVAMMNASLKSHEVFDPSLTFQYPEWLVSGERRSNTILSSSSYEELYGIVSHVNASTSPFPESSPARMDIHQGVIDVPTPTFYTNFVPYTSSAMPEPRRLSEYTCEHCNKKFYNSQAFGGHMSSHSKANRKISRTEEDTATLVPSTED
ncbi:hypothetical protein ACQ4PT_067584 [Festuca glaucescens]